MSLDYVKFTPGFGKFMPKEYRDMVEKWSFWQKRRRYPKWAHSRKFLRSIPCVPDVR